MTLCVHVFVAGLREYNVSQVVSCDACVVGGVMMVMYFVEKEKM